ncbi:MAG: GNAT family N-acetyltransferase [Candidatus Lindowbacteria bacterium]|nr:GNAT family N-acetyltransferase [Candidatus Lindowbacteria bacterium]
MHSDSFVIRNYRSSDVSQYVEFHAGAESICHSVDAFSPASLTDEPPHPVDFSDDNLFLAEGKRTIVGACQVVPELAIDRVVLRLLVTPDFLSRGIAAKLLRSAIERAGELKVARVHADLREEDWAVRDLFAGFGFVPVRRHAEMKLELQPSTIVESLCAGLMYRPLEPGGETKFTQFQNHVFGGSWGFCPNTTSDIIQQLNAPGYGRHGVILAYDGEDAVGYCWSAEVCQRGCKSGALTGRIHMMGVAPEFRGRGLGRHILSSGLKYLASKGYSTVELTVDCENEAACSIYERVGFKLNTPLLWYEKEMTDAKAAHFNASHL